MGYYMGDYYAGARGDPGIGSFFGSLIKSAVGIAVPGAGPALSIAGKAATAGRGIIKAGKGAIMRHPVLSAAGAAGLGGLAVGGVAEHAMDARGRHCRRGTHISKKTGRVVCNRRMNPCNVKALRRASRRAHAFLKISRRLVGYYTPKHKKGRAYIKPRKKSK